MPDPQFGTPRVLGVDDFAIRRGQTYSTVLTSVEDHRVVDVLPTREAGPLAAWLTRHPGVETCVAAHRDCLRNPSPSSILPEATGGASGRPQDDSAPLGRRAGRKKAAHALVHELLAQGHSRRAIARHLGWGLNTVLRYANAGTLAGHLPRVSAPAQQTGSL
ncbi:helix-turn-helix domain-containing protein [Streptomyces sp. NPDC050704]|uniref:helix-turn-helix domain-containing protein n=1 Tax=Streptomyces sp. NPDC050704 TaxID=3157219 RepID=UPI00344297B1